MVPVVLAAFGEGLRIGVIALRSEQPRLFPVAGDPLTAEISQMSGELAALRRMTQEASFDHGATRAAGEEPVGLNGGDTATAEAGASLASDRAVSADAPTHMEPDGFSAA